MGTTRTVMAVAILLLGWLCIVSEAFGETRGIPDVEHNKDIENLGRFAVDEYNKQKNANISFSKVIKAGEKVVTGVQYYLAIEAKDGGENDVYAAELWVNALQNFTQLLQFKPLEILH